jgi:site-specific recombinase XerD
VARTQRVNTNAGATWTVLGDDERVIGPVEEFLEFARSSEYSPNTVKSYARALALWWSFLDQSGRAWSSVGLREFGAFMQSLRGVSDEANVAATFKPVVAEATVAARVRAVLSFYRYHAACGGPSVDHLFVQGSAVPRSYLPFLTHIARRHPQQRSLVKVRVRRSELPIVVPDQTRALISAEASWDQSRQSWIGDVRYRLFWALLEETGIRLGEALSLQHRDWQPGRGSTAAIAIVPRPHPHGLIPKSGYRRVYVSSRLDRLYSDYVWALCDIGADAAITDWDAAYLFCNTRRRPPFGPLRPESVYAHLQSRKHQLPLLPAKLTPHWFRHTHATALLLAGVPLHVVSRRLGHRDVQTTINTYGHVTDDVELAALANWSYVVEGWELGHDQA